jgi:branched-chain amino acid transport system ATP-binding protein
MAQPRLLMLDEPSLGLSPILVRTIFQLINTLNERKTTILLVEQNIRQTLKIAHHAFVMRVGRIVMEGTGSELLANDDIWKDYIGARRVKE